MWTRWQPAWTRRSWTATSAAAVAPARLQPRWTRAPDPPLSARTFCSSPDALDAEQSPLNDDQLRARRSLRDLSRRLRNARSAKQLTAMWSALARYEPVAVDGPFVRPVGSVVASEDESSADHVVTVPDDSLAVRMVPVREMLALARENKRHLVVENAPSYPNILQAEKDEHDDGESIVVSDDRVLLLSESFVARKMLWALYRLGAHHEVVSFLETFEAERSELSETESQGIDSTTFSELTTLGKHIDSLYVVSLGRLHQHSKVLNRFKQQGSDFKRYIISRDAIHALLYACMMEFEGDLAKKILDETLDTPRVMTLNMRPFTLAIHANLRGDIKTLDGLHNALHVYRRMHHEVGYILAPRDWSMLFNACVYLDQSDLAIEVFKEYRVHGIAPFQSRFQQAVRTACFKGLFDTAIEMARVWINVEREAARPALSEERQRAAEGVCFNKILWEMFKGDPTRDQVEQVLALMQQRQVSAGALVLRRTVTHFFQTASEELEPEAVVYRFFGLWEQSPNVIARTPFVLHLVLQECESRGWTEQCERVIEYALDQNIELPFDSTAKLMDRYATRGQFEDAIQLGELVLQPRAERVRAARASNEKPTRAELHDFIPDAFFETLLTSYLFRERFDDVVAVDEAFQLAKRRGRANPKLAAIIRDARSLCY